MITRRRALHGLAAIFIGVGLWGFQQAERIQAAETKKKKKKKKKRGDSDMPNSRNVATIPNFSVANGSYIVPNSDLVTTNFILQGDTSGAGAWSTIPVTEYELFPKTGVIAQRVQDYASGAFVDWSGYQAYRLSAYTKSVSGTRTSYTNQTVTFAESNEGYSPIGQVGELNGEAIKNAIVNILVAAGGSVSIDDSGLRYYDSGGNITVSISGDDVKIVNTSASAPASGLILTSTDVHAGLSVLGYYYSTNGIVYLNVVDDTDNFGFEFDVFGGFSAETLYPKWLNLSEQSVSLSTGSGNRDNVAITSSFVRLTGPTAAWNLTGMANGAAGRVVYIQNNSGFTMTVKNQDTNSSATNRIKTTAAGDVAVADQRMAGFIYDTSDNRWQMLFP